MEKIQATRDKSQRHPGLSGMLGVDSVATTATECALASAEQNMLCTLHVVYSEGLADENSCDLELLMPPAAASKLEESLRNQLSAVSSGSDQGDRTQSSGLFKRFGPR